MRWRAVVEFLKVARNSWERVRHFRTDSRNKPNKD